MEKLNFTFKKEKIDIFIESISDLTKINNDIMLRIDKEYIMLYACIGSGNDIISFKSYEHKTDELLNINLGADDTLTYIITSANKFIRNISQLNPLIDIKVSVSYNKTKNGSLAIKQIKFADGRLSYSDVSGIDSLISFSITRELLYETIDIDNSELTFKMTGSDMSDIKKLSKNNSKKSISLKIKEKKLYATEVGTWTLLLNDNVDYEDKEFSFNKDIIKSIEYNKPFLDFYVFSSFLMYKNDNMILLFAYDLD